MKRITSSTLYARARNLLAVTVLIMSATVMPIQAIPPSQIETETSPPTVDTLKQSRDRWIEINLSTQRLVAWEGDTPVYAIVISTGKDATPTYPGIFKIQSKHQSSRMRGRNYDVPNVPYTMFYNGNYAIHGAYWHRRFGTPVSHGCVNVAVNHAKWLFDWAAIGTPVIVQK